MLRPLQGVPGGIGPDFAFRPLAGGYADLEALAAGRRALWPALLVGAVLLLMLERLLLSWSEIAALREWWHRKRGRGPAGRTACGMMLAAALTLLLPETRGQALDAVRPDR